MATEKITCPMCGFENRADAGRCRSCGAKVEAVTALYSAEEMHRKRYQQEVFEWKWAMLAFGVYLVCQASVLAGLPHLVSTYDPQGLGGLMVSLLVWFGGGIVVGLVSPGKTYVEPAAGAFMAVLPTVGYLYSITPPGFQPTMLAYIVGAMLGVMIALLGAFVGEKVQMMTRGHAKA